MLNIIENYVNRALVFILALQGGALIVLLGIQVFFRYVLHNALSWPEEIAGMVFVWFTLLGIAIGVREDSHICFDLITEKSSPRIRKSIHTFTYILIIIYAYFMIYYGITYAERFSYETTPAANINMIWLNISLPVAGLFIVFFAIIKIIYIIKHDTKNTVSD